MLPVLLCRTRARQKTAPQTKQGAVKSKCFYSALYMLLGNIRGNVQFFHNIFQMTIIIFHSIDFPAFLGRISCSRKSHTCGELGFFTFIFLTIAHASEHAQKACPAGTFKLIALARRQPCFALCVQNCTAIRVFWVTEFSSAEFCL